MNDKLDLNIGLLHDRFLTFKKLYIGENASNFNSLSLPTSKEYEKAVYNIKFGQHIQSGLIPFILPREKAPPIPVNPTRIDVLQYYIDGIAALIVAKSLHCNQERFSKIITIYLSVCALMIEKLSFALKQQQQEQQLLQPPNINNSIIQQLDIPLIIHFKKELECLKQLRSIFISSPQPLAYADAQPHIILSYQRYLFSLLHCGHWTLQGPSDLEKLNYSNKIYENLQILVQKNPNIPTFRYSFGSFCYSFFKYHQVVYRIDSLQFFNFKNDHSFDPKIYSILNDLLNQSNRSYLVEFEKDPINNPEYWFVYAKTCCLLGIEEKAQSWIQLFINDAFNRIERANLVRTDPDIAPYSSKSWYKELMSSIDSEQKRLSEQEIRREQEKQKQQQVQQENNQSLYNEFKQKQIIEGCAPKYMNNDSLLISSVILLSMTQPKESKEAEIAKQRLSERLDLYMLQNSKEIPGDGNCQMHALSDQIFDDLNHSQDVRKTIVDWLRKNKDFSFPNGATLCQFVNGSWEDYCNEMSKNGIWGDHLTLLAAAEIYKAKISIISSVESTSHFFIEIIPTKIENTKVFLLSHYSEFHYGSLCFKP
ncbi:OTU domain-containing protein [Cavenderia fasciculata]|uniref:OTU domain-containing protein n=1 Tax=Cavenderia fasciculata TaxID=261658 RepID=F4PYE9_CACFS|nr:OTU domain-containing protein [Cavenderia fasciculata]EGG19416.1 OTU domain-containing protein [Cavenderia fasciculata]|eukprot:XP_004357687.1 OTU domain-containing protein [Cavenderia fasciculata]